MTIDKCRDASTNIIKIMLNRENHQLIMGRILKDIYTDSEIAPLLGFKGGTCAYFFYGLPRFSVDLDFDLISGDSKTVYAKIFDILKNYGTIKDHKIKKFTIFFVLSYGDSDHNIKIEINTRNFLSDLREQFELKKYLGISMFVAKPDYFFAGKLVALLSRRGIAMRDIYDIHYFAKNNFDINFSFIEIRTGKTLKKYFADCISVIEKIPESQILHGLGELVNEKEKIWIKNHLKSEAVFMLKNYKAVLG